MFELSVPWWEIVLRTALVYAVVFALLRIAGKRELGHLTPFDLVVLLVISNAVQNAMTAGDNSFLGGAIAAATLVGVNSVLARVGRGLPFLSRAFMGEPSLLVRDGRIIKEHLEREDVTREEIEMAAREHGVEGLERVRAAILEVDGSISIIPKEGRAGYRAERLLRRLKGR